MEKWKKLREKNGGNKTLGITKKSNETKNEKRKSGAGKSIETKDSKKDLGKN